MTSVAELFAHAGVVNRGVVRWGEPPSEAGPGVYIVSTVEGPASNAGLSTAPLRPSALEDLLRVRPETAVDGQTATVSMLKLRLDAMWAEREPVAYIGLASTSVRTRVRQFYRTRIGARAPHSGGWPIKMLDPAKLWVHYGSVADPREAEAAMVARFVSGLPSHVRVGLIDPGAAIPFANLTFPGGRRKRHGLSGVKPRRSLDGGE
ncbi:hypothetical protein CQ040_18865 [Microbacterium sp. MYb54]|nr:hypothetical protein CQ032_18060 [Microbacterium sp. MYb43]PQZ73430.1 hypothetical protein CQ031_17325 [Microbacterium sp. MYb40]PRB15656.1 hypothetical protein CQ040_18865 [Microbacterium sp. MYb54]PRB22076.1 hypothetical protein CQ037_18580 [Microbacterium sp. MYb50]PRB60577.1 hypothetical protein CQ021_18955 [Microbacterium sp. MYb24]PRB67944.1 hypothetical protein CQ027_17905 [Microbacterium sp. MYb32]